MAENRQCGYCRTAGHRRPDCPLLKEHRTLVLTHVPKERKAFIEAMGKIGLGIGAILKTEDYSFRSHEAIALVRDFDFIQNCNFMEWRNIKYSKQIRLDPLKIDEDFIYRGVHVAVLCMGEGKAIERNMRINITKELNKLNGKLQPNMYDYHNLLDIQSPSHDIDYDPEILVKNIHMPRRLLLSGEQEYGHIGIMPG